MTYKEMDDIQKKLSQLVHKQHRKRFAIMWPATAYYSGRGLAIKADITAVFGFHYSVNSKRPKFLRGRKYNGATV
jgi:hypothetical protein